VDGRILEQAFVAAFNKVISDEQNRSRWDKLRKEGTPLERVRAKQMIDIAAEGEIENFVPELAQLVVTEVTVFGEKRFEFEFMDGSKQKVRR
jgi:hypothetical protein